MRTDLLPLEVFRIPSGGLSNIESFRRWARSDDFPERGRIDWIGGEVEVDMSPEDLNTHATPKLAIARKLSELIEDEKRGVVVVDRMRVSVPSANLSVEPDVAVVLLTSLDEGRVRLVPKANKKQGRFIEIEGPPEIVVECVSDSSVAKDTKRLLESYDVAGITEYWLVDARGETSEVTIHRRTRGSFRPVTGARGGWARSDILGVAVRLVRIAVRPDVILHRLETRAR